MLPTDHKFEWIRREFNLGDDEEEENHIEEEIVDIILDLRAVVGFAPFKHDDYGPTTCVFTSNGEFLLKIKPYDFMLIRDKKILPWDYHTFKFSSN